MGISEPEKRCAVIVSEIFFSCVCRDETVFIDIVFTAVFGADNLTRSSVKGRIAFICADGFVIPVTCRRTSKTDFPYVTAVPEGRDFIKSAVTPELQININVIEGIGV